MLTFLKVRASKWWDAIQELENFVCLGNCLNLFPLLINIHTNWQYFAWPKCFQGIYFFPAERKNNPPRLIWGWVGVLPSCERICVCTYEMIETQALNSQGKKQEQIRAFSSEITASLFYKHFDISSHFRSTGQAEINAVLLRRRLWWSRLSPAPGVTPALLRAALGPGNPSRCSSCQAGCSAAAVCHTGGWDLLKGNHVNLYVTTQTKTEGWSWQAWQSQQKALEDFSYMLKI